MTVYKSGTPTPYYAAVIAALGVMAGEGITEFSQHDIAARIGRNVTEALRRAMTQAEHDSMVTRKRAYSERGGLMVMYDLHMDYAQLPLKEPPL